MPNINQHQFRNITTGVRIAVLAALRNPCAYACILSEDQYKEMVGQSMTVPSEMESYQDVHLYYLRFKYENGVRINESYDMFANTWLPLRKES